MGRPGAAHRYAALPSRAWSAWAWVRTARGTGAQGSTWKPPRAQYSPWGVMVRRSSIPVARRVLARGSRAAHGGPCAARRELDDHQEEPEQPPGPEGEESLRRGAVEEHPGGEHAVEDEQREDQAREPVA